MKILYKIDDMKKKMEHPGVKYNEKLEKMLESEEELQKSHQEMSFKDR